MLRELGVLGFLGATLWATGLLEANPSRLGDRSPEAAGAANGGEDKRTGPPKQWSAKCEEIITRFEASLSSMSGTGGDAESGTQAIGQTAKQVVTLRDFENDLNAANCPVNARELNEATRPDEFSANGQLSDPL